MPWRTLYYYWLNHHVEGRPPSRADIDPPLEAPELLPNLMLIDIEPTGFRMRLVGSEIARRTGVDTTGRPVEPTQMPGPDIEEFAGFLTKVATRGARVLYRVKHNAQYTKGAIGLLLPLVDRSGSTEMVLGGFFFERDPLLDVIREWDPGPLTELNIEDELAG